MLQSYLQAYMLEWHTGRTIIYSIYKFRHVLWIYSNYITLLLFSYYMIFYMILYDIYGIIWYFIIFWLYVLVNSSDQELKFIVVWIQGPHLISLHSYNIYIFVKYKWSHNFRTSTLKYLKQNKTKHNIESTLSQEPRATLTLLVVMLNDQNICLHPFYIRNCLLLFIICFPKTPHVPNIKPNNLLVFIVFHIIFSLPVLSMPNLSLVLKKKHLHLFTFQFM